VVNVSSSDKSDKRCHQGQKNLRGGFDRVWELLDTSGQQPLETQLRHRFTAFAAMTTRGAHQGERVIRIEKDGVEFARIYECCWRHTTNCYGTRIGGYSDALVRWAAGHS